MELDSGEENALELNFVHRNNVFKLRMPAESTLLELGQQLASVSGVAPHTLRLLLPRAPALLPFSDPHSSLPISQSGISEGRSVRMMGALPGEIKEVSQEKGNVYERTVIGFSDEEERAKRWASGRTGGFKKLPQGSYIFCDFRTLQLPGVELHPPASKALEIMHKLASDPGIVAIMNKHQWRVGVMTEMAPVGYVGVTPECILGYNKNQGEEISLRLRTDDLKGFRKYGSIKKTLLHELAHMVHSAHDANFHGLDKQLNEEAISLDWTKSTGHSLGDSKMGFDDEDEEDARGVFTTRGGHRLGGSRMHSQLDVRSAAALAALSRLSHANAQEVDVDTVLTVDNNANNQEVDIVVEGNEAGTRTDGVSAQEICIIAEGNEVSNQAKLDTISKEEPDPDDSVIKAEPDPDEAQNMEVDEVLIESSFSQKKIVQEPVSRSESHADNTKEHEDGRSHVSHDLLQPKAITGSSLANLEGDNLAERSNGGSEGVLVLTQHPDSSIETTSEGIKVELMESAVEDPGLKSMQEYTEMVCKRLQTAISKLKEEATPSEAGEAFQTLFKILRNLKEHPHDPKFKCLRKANMVFQNRIARFKGALEVLHAVGFSDGPCESVNGTDCLVLKRNDPVLIWLAQTSLEACIA